MSLLSLTHATVKQGAVSLLKDVSFSISAGKLVGIVGPNGAGKTTAVRALLGLVPLTKGQAAIDTKDVKTLSPQDQARKVAYLPQTRSLAWPISVREVVALGRFAYGGASGRLGQIDRTAIDEAMTKCNLMPFAQRSVASLSGGELARVHIARAFAAQTPALIADEPIAALDPRHALEVLGLLKAKAQSGAAVLVVLHDLNWAARFCDEIILMDQGEITATGPVRDVLTVDALARVFGINANWKDNDLLIQGVA